MTDRPLIGLNRWDWRSVDDYVDSVRVAEAVGVDIAFQPVNPLKAPDPYLLLGAAARATDRIRLGTLLETPVLRPPAIAAGSTATLARASGGRAMLTYGAGDTAVYTLGLHPATVSELERATVDVKRLLAGERIEVAGGATADLTHAAPAPVWLAAGGPKTLRMAGRVADGVFLRVGTRPANIVRAVDLVRTGAAEAGRAAGDVGIGLIVHTIRSADPGEVLAIGRTMAAGFYEHSPTLFDPPGFEWNGPPIDELRRHAKPDFHHAADLVAAGDVVGFLSDDIAASFSFAGPTEEVAAQIDAIRALVPEIEIVVPHPVPMPSPSGLRSYARWLGEELKPQLASREHLG